MFECVVLLIIFTQYSPNHRTGCPVSAVVSTLTSHQGHPGSIPGLGACEFGLWSPSRTSGFSPGTPVSPSHQDNTLAQHRSNESDLA